MADSFIQTAEQECEDCDAGAECGMCLMLLREETCPDSIDAFQHDIDAAGLEVRFNCEHIPSGGVCEGSGECGTDDDANNCLELTDVYRRVDCSGDFADPMVSYGAEDQPPPPSPLLTPPPPCPHPPPPRPLPPPQHSAPVARSIFQGVAAHGSQSAPSSVAPVVAVLLTAAALIFAVLAATWARKRGTTFSMLWRLQRKRAASLMANGTLSVRLSEEGPVTCGLAAPASCELGELGSACNETGQSAAGSQARLPMFAADAPPSMD